MTSLSVYSLIWVSVTLDVGYPLTFFFLSSAQAQAAAKAHSAAERSQPTPEVGAAAAICWSSPEDIPCVQGKRNQVRRQALREGIRGQTDRNHNHRQQANLITWTTALSNSMKQAMPCGATKDGWVMVERSDRRWSAREGNGKPLQYSCLENPMNSMKKQKDRTLKDKLPRSVDAHYAAGDQWRNNSRKNEGMEPKQKQHPVVDGTGHKSKVSCCKQQYCIGTWNVRSISQFSHSVVFNSL